MKGLFEHHYDLGFARIDAAGSGLQAQSVWSDPLVAALPARHPLLSHRRILLQELVRHPLILSHSEVHEGQFQQISRLLRAHLSEEEATHLNVAEQYISRETMQALIAAGYGVALVSGTERNNLAGSGIVTRVLSFPDSELTTYLLRPASEPSAHLSRFLNRVGQTCRRTDETSPQGLFDSLRPLTPLPPAPHEPAPGQR